MSAEEPVVFIVDDDQSLCEALQRLLATVGLKAQTFGSAQEFIHERQAARRSELSLPRCATARAEPP